MKKKVEPVQTTENVENGQADSKLNKRDKKALLRSGIRLYIVLAIIALVVTFGWFTINTLVFVENEEAGNIQISVTSGDLWIANSLDEFDDENFANKAQLLDYNYPTQTLIDVTGDGQTMWYPKSVVTNASDNTDTVFMQADNFSDVSNDPEFFMELRVYFRTTSKMDVYLTNESAITIQNNNLNNVGGNDAFDRTSLFGNFNCDGIIGAARVAFLESNMPAEGEEEVLTLKNVWIPNDDIQLSYAANTTLPRSSATLTQNTNADSFESRTTGYGYLAKNGDDMEMVYYTPEDYYEGRVMATSNTNINTVLANPVTKMINQTSPVLSFEHQGEVQTKLLVIRIWIEGTDNEADKALNGGMMKYKFGFVGIDKAENTTHLAEESTIANNSIPTGKIALYYNTVKKELCVYTDADSYNQNTATPVDMTNFLLYSFDGLTWEPYNSTTALNIIEPKRGENPITMYVRGAEDTVHKPGNVVAITIPAE